MNHLTPASIDQYEESIKSSTLVRLVSEDLGLPFETVNKARQALGDLIIENLVQGNRVKVRGLGIMTLKPKRFFFQASRRIAAKMSGLPQW